MSAPSETAKPAQARNEWANERHVYEPHIVGLPPIGQYAREVWRRREFAIELSRTDLRAQHFDTVFGQLWLVLNPMLLAGVYFILVDIVRRGHHAQGFFAHLVACIFAYYFLSGALRDAVKSVTSGSKLILNSSFPRALLPLSSVVTAFKRFVPTAVIYIPVHLISGLPVGPSLLWLIPLTILLAVLTAGFSLIVAAGQVYFRDLSSFLPYVLRIWLYVSPVLYFAHDMPRHYRWLLDVNPIGQLLTAWGNLLHSGASPGHTTLGVAALWAIGTFVVGSLFFMSRERDFAVRL